jgi:hypothetical protein
MRSKHIGRGHFLPCQIYRFVLACTSKAALKALELSPQFSRHVTEHAVMQVYQFNSFSIFEPAASVTIDP